MAFSTWFNFVYVKRKISMSCCFHKSEQGHVSDRGLINNGSLFGLPKHALILEKNNARITIEQEYSALCYHVSWHNV